VGVGEGAEVFGEFVGLAGVVGELDVEFVVGFAVVGAEVVQHLLVFAVESDLHD
jgi:hypothetical protein